MQKPSNRALPKPSVFKIKDRWVCEYYVLDEKGQPKARRKSFVRELKKKGLPSGLNEQRTAALNYRDEWIRANAAEEKARRTERQQKILTPRQLHEARAAFAIFDKIPNRKKSLVDAVILYREKLQIPADTLELTTCVGIFLDRKAGAVEKGQISDETHRTLKQRLNKMGKFLTENIRPKIKLGEVNSSMLITFLEGLQVGDRTRRNYMNDLLNFFNDASDPLDKDRFISENPMDGVRTHYKKNSGFRNWKLGQDYRKSPTILKPAQFEQTMKIAFEMRREGMLGFAVTGLYLGLRPSELYDLVNADNFWTDHIKLNQGVVRIDGFGKKRDQRNIRISEACSIWLKFIKENNLPLCFKRKANGQSLHFSNFRARAFLKNPEDAKRLIKLRALHKSGRTPSKKQKEFMVAKNKELQGYEDVLRHTFGTYFYTASGYDKNLTVEQMGHGSEVFVEHYRGLLNHPDDHLTAARILPANFLAEEK